MRSLFFDALATVDKVSFYPYFFFLRSRGLGGVCALLFRQAFINHRLCDSACAFVLSEMAASHASRRYTHSAITTTSTIITA